MTWLSDLLPPLANRLAEGRPVLTKDQLTILSQHIMGMTSADTVDVRVTHTAQVITRMANNHVLTGDDGDILHIEVGNRFGDRQSMTVMTNQLDEPVLRAMVRQCEMLAREGLGSDDVVIVQPQVPDTLVSTKLWKDDTIRAMISARVTVVPDLLQEVTKEQLNASGFVGLMARSESLLAKDGISVYSEETDSEVTVTARTTDGKTSGWGGQASRNWAEIKPRDIAAHAVEMAKRGANPEALEPGRRTAILGPSAVIQIVRYLAHQFDAEETDKGLTGFSNMPRGNKLGRRVFDSRINMQSNPADPDGGYRPYFGRGYGTPAMTWVDHGILKNLAYSPTYAMGRGKAYAEHPWSIRVSGGDVTVADMIAQCREGVYVNRFSAVELADYRTGLTTGTTRDGCFLVRNGKIERGIKNFRFLDSPFFFLNRIEALSPTTRAAFGYAPKGATEYNPYADWPRRPIIAPAMMVRDFNFSGLVDAV